MNSKNKENSEIIEPLIPKVISLVPEKIPEIPQTHQKKRTLLGIFLEFYSLEIRRTLTNNEEKRR